MNLGDKKLDMASVIERVAKATVVYQVPRITRCFLSESRVPGEEGIWRVKTEGVNIQVNRFPRKLCKSIAQRNGASNFLYRFVNANNIFGGNLNIVRIGKSVQKTERSLKWKYTNNLT